jgi:TATA-box binding protein (TBP) (component of TFIID and TFIIIB)
LETGEHFSAMLKDVSHTNSTIAFHPTPLCVSTITITGKLDTASVPIDAILEGLLKHGRHYHDMELPPPGKRASFHNQLTVKCNRMSVKLFRNGSIQVTGCRSVVHFGDVIDRLLTSIAILLDDEQPMALVSTTIVLINANFNAGKALPLRILRDILVKATPSLVASYNPTEYPGINAKIPTADGTVVTALIFETGSVMLSGAKSPRSMAHAYRTLCGLINTTPGKENVAPNASKPTVTKALLEAYDIVDGYSFRVGHLCAGATS